MSENPVRKIAVIVAEDSGSFDPLTCHAPGQETEIVQYLDKAAAEIDPRYRQLIPYVLLLDKSNDTLLMYRRKCGEQRLEGLLSIGIGGHVEAGETWFAGMARELQEEAGLTNVVVHPGCNELTFDQSHELEACPFTVLGKIVLSATEVDSVHLGICVLVEIDSSLVTPQAELNKAQWVHIGMLDEIAAGRQPVGALESWSVVALQLLLDHMAKCELVEDAGAFAEDGPDSLPVAIADDPADNDVAAREPATDSLSPGPLAEELME